MSNRFDSLIINCPKCNKSHQYKLEIHRSIIMYHQTASTKTKEYKFTRIFICPDTNKKFQVCFVVIQQSGEVIHDVFPVNYPKEESDANEEKQSN